MTSRPRPIPAGGFTLIEVVIAVSMLVFLSMLMTQVITGTSRGVEMTNEALRAPTVANAIFSQIFKDFRYIYWGGFAADGGFRAKSQMIAGKDADTVSFVTARTTRNVGSEEDGRRSRDEQPSPLTEVGYVLRVSESDGRYLELWRREDYFVDSQPTQGGQCTLLYDRIRAFRLRYYPVPEEAQVQEGLEEWDSVQRHGIPYAILLRIDFDVPRAEEAEANRFNDEDYETIYRIILLRGAYSVKWEGTPQPEAGQPGS